MLARPWAFGVSTVYHYHQIALGRQGEAFPVGLHVCATACHCFLLDPSQSAKTAIRLFLYIIGEGVGFVHGDRLKRYDRTDDIG